ncbi:MAG: hypothetical protein A3E80_00485 [Chlamydiae bacterium RIFCSPHIGHO2_12_FULL_49_9]|nr:MAG: hypothetical protein A3E80_00485 [Chlamydiae bacterium RIFCSPHIGHO2_12_FULL_49_9]
MPLFQYQALSKKGRKYQRTIDAESLLDAKMKLGREQIPVFEISPLSQKQIKAGLSNLEVLNLTREIGRLLQAGLPLFEALLALEEKYRAQKAHPLLLDLSDRVRSGQSFSEALSSHSSSFDLLYTSMISNAEKTGRLAAALNDLSQLLSREQQVKRQLLAALLYPALLFSFCLVVLSSLLFFVIPALQELFEGRDLHPFTQVVFGASRLACKGKYILLSLACAFLGLVFAAFFSKKWRAGAAAFLLKVPFLKSILAKAAFVRFFRAAATLLEGGLPLLSAFDQARRVMHHPFLESVIARAEERISQGDSICAPFQNNPLIPPLIPRLLSIAEQGGNLPFMMKQIAQIYEEELEKTLSDFTTVAQPVLLLFLGVVIGFVLLSVLLPLTDVSSFATG